MNQNENIEKLFSRLDAWRHLPAYQLERRADVFFSLYLRDVLEEELGVRLRGEILPEFPLNKRVIWPEDATEQSVKVDFALFEENLAKVFLVELKTDAASRRTVQDEYLLRAKDVGFRTLVRGVVDSAIASKAHQKYHYLLAALARLGFLEMPGDIGEYVHPKTRQGLTKRLEAIAISGIDPAVEVVYVQPRATENVTCIDFARFAAHVEKHGDALSQRLAKSLREWVEPAGATRP